MERHISKLGRYHSLAQGGATSYEADQDAVQPLASARGAANNNDVAEPTSTRELPIYKYAVLGDVKQQLAAFFSLPRQLELTCALLP